MDSMKEMNAGATTVVPLRPSMHAERRLIMSVLDGTFPPGTVLPGERALASMLGVTRPTIRETLHRLAREGWFSIRHGKSTLVNDYWNRGGTGLLSTLSQYVEYLPGDFIAHLLELRAHLLPIIARRAVRRSPEKILERLKKARDLEDEPAVYSAFDWELQILMARNTGNPIYPMLLNDFEDMFKTLAFQYFSRKTARRSSRDYYGNLRKAILAGGRDVEQIVLETMEDSIKVWRKLKRL